MHPRAAIPPALLQLARCQAGVVTREQAQAYGISSDVLGRLSR